MSWRVDAADVVALVAAIGLAAVVTWRRR